MKFLPLSLFCFFLLQSCTARQSPPSSPAGSIAILHKNGTTIASRFNPPPGFTRMKDGSDNSYSAFLRSQTLYPDGTLVHYYDGREKANDNIYAAVLKIDRGTDDLQQCADAVMRLRAEWLWAVGLPGQIHFTLTSGLSAPLSKWQEGYRIVTHGPSASWVKKAAPANDYASFRQYMNAVFTYAGTRSLMRELKPVAIADMRIGDVLIVGGSPGHAVTVMDMAQNSEGKKVFLLSQSYMPAQDIQILCNPDNPEISP